MLGINLSLPGVAVRRGGTFPSLDLNFLNGTMPAGLTFTRASTAWAYNSSGVLTSYATNAARLDYDPVTLLSKGLLIEEARTNLFLNSAVGVTQSCTVAAAANTLSFFGTGTVTLTGVSTAGPLVGTGAANRVSLTFTPTAGSLTLTVSGPCTNVQLELGAYATSPIVTVGSTVTRAADLCSMTLGSWFNASAGTFMAETETIGTNLSRSVIAVSDGTAAEFFQINTTSGGLARFNVTDGSVAQASIASAYTVPAAGSVSRVAIAYALNDFAISGGGGTVAVDTSGTLPTVTRVYLGAGPTGSTPNAIHVRRLAYHNRRLPDATLRVLTA